MKKQWIVAVVLVLCCLMIGAFFILRGFPEQTNPETPPTTLSVEEILYQQVIAQVSGSEYIPAEEQDFWEDYQAYFDEDLPADPTEELLRAYAAQCYFRIELLDGETAQISVDVPDLAGILSRAFELVETLDGDINPVRDEMVRILESGDFARKSSTITVSYSLSEDSTPMIAQNEEYLDAIYGGLVSAAQEKYTEFWAAMQEQEVLP